MLNRNFSSIHSAITFLRESGFKPIISTPKTWKKVEEQSLREVELHVSPRSDRVKLVEVLNGKA